MFEAFGSQQSDAWLRVRVGRITGSRIADVCSYLTRASNKKKAGDPSAKRDDYKLEIITARLTGRHKDHYTTPAMERGTMLEDDARLYYEGATRQMAEPVGFVVHREYDFTGASADSLVGEDGVLEIKCPLPWNHLEYVLDGEVPAQYMPQIQWEMACSGRKWCDFVSFCPDIPTESLRFFYRRVERDEQLIARYTDEVLKFEAEIKAFMEEHGATPIAPFPPEIRQPDEPEPDAGENGFDPSADAFAYLDAQELVP